MLTAANIAANRKTLTDLLIAQMNLPAARSAWTYSQRVDYNKAFAAYVLAHPDSFDAQAQQTAQVVTAELPQDLSDTSVSADLAAFGSAVIDNAVAAGNQVAGVGQGVLSLAGMAKWLIPAAGLVAVGILLYGLFKKGAK